MSVVSIDAKYERKYYDKIAAKLGVAVGLSTHIDKLKEDGDLSDELLFAPLQSVLIGYISDKHDELESQEKEYGL
jgi:hypothetical protein